MSKTFVVVESPAKAKTIEKFLGKNFVVKASMGHLRDLPKSQLGIDLEHDYQPKYINVRGKGALIKELKKIAHSSDRVLLATDPDREGEAIAWHLAHILNIDTESPCRIIFNEITKETVQKAAKQSRKINMPMVDAQQTRRILDRIVGYKLSPLLWKKVQKGLSAGRVQSVALRLISDREQDINDFIVQEYWSFSVELTKEKSKTKLIADVEKYKNKKLKVDNEEDAKKVEAELSQQNYQVHSVDKSKLKRKPSPPFITSSLQQESFKKLGFATKKTMLLAQQLYEGISMGKAGHVGLITYMRTDSTRVSSTAIDDARTYIKENHGDTYIPTTANFYTSKKSNTQDAHEAIRPSSVAIDPIVAADYLNKDQLKLYTLIWQRFVASQMSPAVFDTISIKIKAGDFDLKSTGSIMAFDGFLKVYDKARDNKDKKIPELTKDELLTLQKVLPPVQHFTEPPARYNEASLVKELEEKGIGRPSTYAPTIQTIQDRGYVGKEEKKLYPTELGLLVINLLKEYFANIVNVNFSAQLENRLDEVAESKLNIKQVLDDFYTPFAETLSAAEEQIGQIEIKPEVSDIPCDKCGTLMVIKNSRYGKFLACPKFPDCRNTKPIRIKINVPCPSCSNDIVELKSKRGKKFFGCEKYPECSFVAWDKPVDEYCNLCGSILLAGKERGGKQVNYCSNENCEKGKKVHVRKKSTKTS